MGLATPKPTKGSLRFWLAVALAPLSVLVFEAVRLSWDDGQLLLDVRFALLYVFFSYAGMLLFGLPYVLLLRWKDKLTFVALLIGGLVSGPLYFELLDAVIRGRSPKIAYLFSSDMILPALLSMTVAVVFGLIAKARIR